MAEHLFQRGPARFFRGLGPRAQVALCQLPLTLIVAALAVATPYAWPTLVNSPMYLSGILLHGVLFLGCLLVPWERLAHQGPGRRRHRALFRSLSGPHQVVRKGFSCDGAADGTFLRRQQGPPILPED